MNMLARRLGRLEEAATGSGRMVVVIAGAERETAPLLAARSIVEGVRDLVVRVRKPLGADVRVTVDGVAR
jgi:hypothetical protein